MGRKAAVTCISLNAVSSALWLVTLFSFGWIEKAWCPPRVVARADAEAPAPSCLVCLFCDHFDCS